MKVLVVCQYYYPEPFRITDICEELVKRGNDVTVITGIPNYPMGEIYEGYRKGKKRDEVINGVKVHRCFTVGRRHGILYRMLNYYSYAFSSANYVSKLAGDFDVVFVNQLSPVMMAKAGIRYKKRHNKRLVMYCLDLWPESLAAGGIGRGSALFGHFRRVSEKIYKSADSVLVSSGAFREYFADEFGITDTVYLPQYAEALFTPEQCRKTPDEFTDLMFAGNLGAAQSVNTIIEAAKLTADIGTLRWHIVGDGSEYENLKQRAAGLDNVIFHGRKPLSEMPKYYAMADSMLVTMQKDPVISMTLPGKVQTYMAAGKPIIGAIDGETKAVITESGAGSCCGAEDAQELARLAREFVANVDKRKLADSSYGYYRSFFGKDSFFNTLSVQLGNAEQ